AGHHGNGAALAALVVAPHQDVAVLALRDHHRGDARVVEDLHAVGAVVDPAGIRILHDDHAAGTDVGPAVVLLPLRRRNPREVDLLAGGDVLEHGTGLDDGGRNRSALAQVAAPVLHEVHLGRVG